ncbi:MAG: 2-hydroxy-3-oxopropionate reductase, partial [Alphaproteobacteria bacterium]|nr:2-hydroxy-3-oxopropionate reductase [Alphaproteobacteria bacterium]
PGFRTEIQQKRFESSVVSGSGPGVVLPLAATAEGLYNALTARGRGKEDHSAIVRILEELAACKVAPLDKDTS